MLNVSVLIPGKPCLIQNSFVTTDSGSTSSLLNYILFFGIFSKESVERLADMLETDLIYDTRRGVPMSPVQQVCIALHHYGGNQFQRVSGVCAGVSQFSARKALVRVTEALVKLRQEYIFMPSAEEMETTCAMMLERFGLPRFSMAVDGMMVPFVDAPRGLPPGKHKQQFWCRYGFDYL